MKGQVYSARPLIAISAAILLTGSCNSPDTSSYSGLNATPAVTRLGSALSSSGKCPSEDTEESAAVLLTLAGSFGAQFIVEAVGGAIRQYKDGLTGQFLASGVVKGDHLRDGSCLIIVRGLFGETNVDAARADSGQISRLGLADWPAFYMEIKVTREPASLILRPVYIVYSKSAARTRGSGEKSVSVVIVVSKRSMDKPLEVNEADAVAVFRHNLGRLEIGRSYNDQSGSKLLAGTASSHYIGAEFDSAAYAVVAVVTESEEPGIALKALAQTFEAKKGGVEEALADAIKNLLAAGADKDGSQ